MGFEVFWNRYYPGLLVYFRNSFPLSREDAEDMVQETLFKVYRNRASYNGETAFSTWVYTIGRNTCIDFLRQARNRYDAAEPVSKEPAPGAEEFPDARPGPETLALRKEEGREIREAILDILSPADREILFLRMYKEMPYREISAMTGKPVGTIKYRFFEIRNLLKKRLGADHGT